VSYIANLQALKDYVEKHPDVINKASPCFLMPESKLSLKGSNQEPLGLLKRANGVPKGHTTCEVLRFAQLKNPEKISRKDLFSRLSSFIRT
jgi:hypothetical protein